MTNVNGFRKYKPYRAGYIFNCDRLFRSLVLAVERPVYLLFALKGHLGRAENSDQTGIVFAAEYGADNIVAVHIRHIREKIEINPREPRYLKVVWGLGYKIDWQG